MPIRKRGDTWQVDVQLAGKRHRQSVGTKKEAQELETRLKAQLVEDRHADRMGRAPKRTIEQALVKWVQSEAPETMKNHIHHVNQFIGQRLLTDAPQAATEMVAAMVASGLSNQTINRRLSVVKRVLKLAYANWGWLPEPLHLKIQKLSERGAERHVYLTREQVDELAGRCPEDVGRAILILAYTGLRMGELEGLIPEQVAGGRIALGSDTKSGKPRIVPIPEGIEFVFPLPTRGRIRTFFERARAEMGLEHVRLHDLRHTTASWLVENPEIPLTAVRDWLGHSSLAVTSRYSHLRDGVLESAASHLRHKGGKK